MNQADAVDRGACFLKIQLQRLAGALLLTAVALIYFLIALIFGSGLNAPVGSAARTPAA